MRTWTAPGADPSRHSGPDPSPGSSPEGTRPPEPRHPRSRHRRKGTRMLLPIADLGHVRTTAGRLIRRHWRGLAVVLLLHLVAALCGLVAPRAVGILVDALTRGTATPAG